MCPLEYGIPHPWCLSPALTKKDACLHILSPWVSVTVICEEHAELDYFCSNYRSEVSVAPEMVRSFFVPSLSWCWSHPLSSCHVLASLHTGVNCTDGETASWCELVPFLVHDWWVSAIRESNKFQKSVLCWFVTHLAAASFPSFHMSILK